MATNAAERFGPPADQRETEAVRESLHRHQGDPAHGHAPADVQEAVRQDQRGTAQTPVVTQSGEQKDVLAAAETTPDLPKNDPAEKAGPSTPAPELSPESQRELNDIGVTLAQNGVTGGEEYQLTPIQEANQPVMEPVETAAERYGDKSQTPPEPEPEMEPDR